MNGTRVRLAICRDVTAVRRYLWLKAVRAVDLEHHCARSLVGGYLRVDRRAWVQDVVLPPAPSWYFCGVTNPYSWADNDHALLIPAPGHTAEHQTPGYTLSVENARFITPTAGAVPMGARHAERPRYLTCRNWQAAHWLARFAALPSAGAPAPRTS